MHNINRINERGKLEALRGNIFSEIELIEKIFDSLPPLQPALDWLEDIKNQLQEHESILASEEGDEPLDLEDVEELKIWSENFSDCLSEGEDIGFECVIGEDSDQDSFTLNELINRLTKSIQETGRSLYNASIRAE